MTQSWRSDSCMSKVSETLPRFFVSKSPFSTIMNNRYGNFFKAFTWNTKLSQNNFSKFFLHTSEDTFVLYGDTRLFPKVLLLLETLDGKTFGPSHPKKEHSSWVVLYNKKRIRNSVPLPRRQDRSRITGLNFPLSTQSTNIR